MGHAGSPFNIDVVFLLLFVVGIIVVKVRTSFILFITARLANDGENGNNSSGGRVELVTWRQTAYDSSIEPGQVKTM